jgi:hypothetical protein
MDGYWMELDRAIARVSQNTHLMLFCPRHRDAAYSAVRTVQYITHRSHIAGLTRTVPTSSSYGASLLCIVRALELKA